MVIKDISWTEDYWYTIDYTNESPVTFKLIEITEDKILRVMLCDESRQKLDLDKPFMKVTQHGKKSPC